MGQDITALITNQDVTIPNDIVHFIEDGITIIPLQIAPYSVDEIVREAFHTRSGQLEDLMLYLRKQAAIDENDDLYLHTLKHVVHLIDELNLHTFIIEHTSDWADIPDNAYFVAVVNNQILHQSAYSSDFRFGSSGYSQQSDFYLQLGLKHEWTSNHKRFHNFECAQEEYGSFHPGESYKSEFIKQEDGKMYDIVTTESGKKFTRDLSGLYHPIEQDESKIQPTIHIEPFLKKEIILPKKTLWKFWKKD